ncbi:MAG: hypothetical protein Q4Q23_07175 [Methanobacteriaceae archaeon]|nr:hypothetical protein [Methanobacteriaceae archaeon]
MTCIILTIIFIGISSVNAINTTTSEDTITISQDTTEISSNVKDNSIANNENIVNMNNTVSNLVNSKENKTSTISNIKNNLNNNIQTKQEITDNTIQENNINTQLKSGISYNNIIYVSSNGTGLGDTKLNPTNLTYAINNVANVNDGTWTIIAFNGTYNFNSQLEITCTNLTINGSSSLSTIFDGQNKTRMFYLHNQKDTLTLNNINFINGYSNMGNSLGGAIYCANGNLNINNCNFNNNKVTYNGAGGAIAFYDSNSTVNKLNIYGCNFTNNKGGHYGGALRIYSEDDSYVYEINIFISNCNFINNSLSYMGSDGARGGAINLHNLKSRITYCNFINNYAVECGGAIRTDSVLYLENCVFDSNTIKTGNGTAIFNNNGETIKGKGASDLYLTNCTFKNHENTIANGTIFNMGKANIYILGISNFIYNSALNGGVIFNDGGNITIGQGINYFIYNSALNGGVIYNNGGIINISNINATNNNVTASGGFIYNQGGSIAINKSYFKGNTATIGGVIFNRNNSTYKFIIENSLFENNKATSTGGVIVTISKITTDVSLITIKNSNFKNNTANYGGVIATRAEVNIENSNFDYNSANSGGAIYNNLTITKVKTGAYDIKVAVNNSNFTYNKAILADGGAIYNIGVVQINNSYFTNNMAKREGGAIYTVNPVYGSDYINNSYLINNTAEISGGVIYNTVGVFTLENSKFIENSAGGSGGVIHNHNGTLITINNLFKNNIAKGTVGSSEMLNLYNLIESGYGGVIINNYNLTSKNDGFYNNNAKLSGGAIYNYGEINQTNILVSLINDTFEENKANCYGGAIFIENSTDIDIMDTSFIKNGILVSLYNEETYGGGVYTINSEILLENNIFLENIAGRGAGLCCVGTGDVIVLNTNFTNNNAYSSVGGAISNNGSDVYIAYSIFTKNRAVKYGGAVVNSQGDIISYENLFINNIVSNDNGIAFGGAIANNGTLSSKNDTFLNNIAESISSKGGAIYILGEHDLTRRVDIILATCINNTAVFGGAVSIENSTVVYVGDSIFKYNTAKNSFVGGHGGAIYNFYGNNSINLQGVLELYNNSFEYNTALNNINPSYGGAIFNGGTAGEIIGKNLVFISNSATNGGAISLLTKINIKNSSFINNSASYEGGAIYGSTENSYSSYSGTSTTLIDNCNFTGNYAGYSAGGVYNHGTLNASNSIFYNNIGRSYAAGAIGNFEGDLTLWNNIFIGNNATFGGAIGTQGKLNSTNNQYYNNTASNLDGSDGKGGAIYNLGYNNSLNYITKDIFSNNTAILNGGAISVKNNDIVIINSSIINDNGALKEAGAIYIQNTKNVTITNSSIINNIALKSAAFNIENSTLIIAYSIIYNNHQRINQVITADAQSKVIAQYNWWGINPQPNQLIKENIITSNVDAINPIILEITNNTGGKLLIIGNRFTEFNITLNKYNDTNGNLQLLPENGNFPTPQTITLKAQNMENGKFNYYPLTIDLQTTTKGNYTGLIKPNGLIEATVDGQNVYLYTIINTKINIINQTTQYNNKHTITLNVTSNGILVTNGNLTININGKYYTTNVTNGIASIIYDGIDPVGKYIMNITYIDTTNQYGDTTDDKHSITITQADTIITIPDTTIHYKDITYITATIMYNSNGNYLPVPEGTVIFTINKTEYTTYVSQGTATIYYYNNDPAGTYIITANYSGTNFNQVTNISKLTILKNNVDIETQPIIGSPNTTITITANISDDYNGGIITEGIIKIYLNGTYIGQSNITNGKIAYTTTIPNWPKGQYNITLEYPETQNYNNKTINSTLTINKATIVVIDNKVTNIGNVVIFTANITDMNKNKIPYGIVTFKLNGVTIGSTNVTNGKAEYKFKIPDTWTAKNYTITAKYTEKTNNTQKRSNQTLTLLRIKTQ